jgi:hypothetical protein
MQRYTLQGELCGWEREEFGKVKQQVRKAASEGN